jgi:hypothetical protein
MAECELRQRKKEDEGVKLENNEEINVVEQEQVLRENKPETVRYISTYLFM